MSKIRLALIGFGQFGRQHARVIAASPRAELAAIVETDSTRAVEAASFCKVSTLDELPDVEAAVVAVPTLMHAEIGCALMERGIDVLIEKPIAADLESADRLIDAAHTQGRILQVGHLERFNPAVIALDRMVTRPLFFEIHRLSVFSPRSLDIDVVLDLMIHDIDIVLSLTGRNLEEVRAAGISILSSKVDIANVRLQFEGGCVANLTASRVSTERVRKLRLFQPHQYISLDYGRQDGAVFTVGADRKIGFAPLPANKGEPLALQLDAFLDSVESRAAPKLGGTAARRTLEAALSILVKIEEHAEVVSRSLAAGWEP